MSALARPSALVGAPPPEVAASSALTPEQTRLAAYLWGPLAFRNTDAIVLAQAKPERPLLSRCLALLHNETQGQWEGKAISGGLNIFGHEGSACPAEWWGTAVTEAHYITYRTNLSHGDTPNGVGMCQLTDPPLTQEADRLGGAWLPEPQCNVGFHFLYQLMREHGEWGGFMHYNGSGPDAEAYADRATRYAAWVHDELISHGF